MTQAHRVPAALALVVALSTIASAEVVGYWPFDAGSGMVAFDHAPAGNDALLRGTRWAEGPDGVLLEFAGAESDQHIVIPHDSALRMDRAFTVQFRWLKRSGAVQIFFRKGPPGKRFTAYAYLEGDLTFTVVGGDGEQFSISVPAPEDGWHDLAFSFGDGHMTIIVDGEVAGDEEVGGEKLYAVDSPLLVGTYMPGYKWSLGGLFDDLCISNEALGPDELEAERERARAFEPPASRMERFEATEGGMVLAKGGVPGASIVIADDASPLQLEPALELRRCVAEMTGARLPLAYATDPPEGNLVLVGDSTLTGDLDLPDDLSGDEYVIRSEPGRLVLLGNDSLLSDDPGNATHAQRSKHGTSNAVYAFLQDHCGVRFFMPGRLGEVLPEHETLEIPALDVREQPWRTYSLGSLSRDDAWARKHLIGSSVLIHHRGGHLWYSLIPEKQHFDEHPEWFALRDGKRQRQGNHLCTTDPQMRALALKRLRDLFDSGYEWVELGQTDGYKRCCCERCEALDDYDAGGWWLPGVPADRIHLFHDWLAREIAKSHPDRTIVDISYGPSAEVPEAVESFGDNVVVEFTHSPQSLIDRWTAWHDRFTAYVYWWGLYQRIGFGPKSSPGYVASEVRRMVDAGVEAFYLCGGGDCWATEAPGYYVYSRMQRDPTLDEDALMDEFCEGLFGEQADAMRAYFDAFFEAADRYRVLGHHEPVIGEPYHGERRPTSEWYLHSYPDEWLDRCAALLDEAEAEARSDDVLARIAYFRDGFDYVRVTTACYHTLVAWQQEKTEANLAAHRDAVEAREAFVEAMLERDAARAGDLPPCFSLGRKWLLNGPRDRYADLYAPLAIAVH